MNDQITELEFRNLCKTIYYWHVTCSNNRNSEPKNVRAYILAIHIHFPGMNYRILLQALRQYAALRKTDQLLTRGPFANDAEPVQLDLRQLLIQASDLFSNDAEPVHVDLRQLLNQAIDHLADYLAESERDNSNRSNHIEDLTFKPHHPVMLPGGLIRLSGQPSEGNCFSGSTTAVHIGHANFVVTYQTGSPIRLSRQPSEGNCLSGSTTGGPIRLSRQPSEGNCLSGSTTANHLGGTNLAISSLKNYHLLYGQLSEGNSIYGSSTVDHTGDANFAAKYRTGHFALPQKVSRDDVNIAIPEAEPGAGIGTFEENRRLKMAKILTRKGKALMEKVNGWGIEMIAALFGVGIAISLGVVTSPVSSGKRGNIVMGVSGVGALFLLCGMMRRQNKDLVGNLFTLFGLIFTVLGTAITFTIRMTGIAAYAVPAASMLLLIAALLW